MGKASYLYTLAPPLTKIVVECLGRNYILLNDFLSFQSLQVLDFCFPDTA